MKIPTLKHELKGLLFTRKDISHSSQMNTAVDLLYMNMRKMTPTTPVAIPVINDNLVAPEENISHSSGAKHSI